MKSPKDMRVIQIDVTNACPHNCSNCTRFCGHHKKPFFMSFETFKKAVNSLDGYVGTIGIMGGEPTLHPEFPRMAKYLAAKKPAKHSDEMLRPQQNFVDGIHDLEFEHTFPYPCNKGMRQTINGPGLWSSIGRNYKKYYEIIQDTMQYQILNDHLNEVYHQPALISRKSLGIPDNEWKNLRDSCWVQNRWSATITPKGAFFCEVAGALDMLFNGPGGWKIEPGWWQRTPEEFGNQLEWCELCGLACDTFTRNANEGIDDISADLYERLRQIGSRKVGTNQINVLKIENGKILEESKAKGKWFGGEMPYTANYSDRFNNSKTNLTDKKIIGIYICTGEDLSYGMENFNLLSDVSVYADSTVISRIKNAFPDKTGMNFFDKNQVPLGYVLYETMKAEDYNTYALIVSGKVCMTNLLERLKYLVLNPGTLLYKKYTTASHNHYFKAEYGGEALLLNGTAQSIRDIGWDAILRLNNLEELVRMWKPKKILDFAPEIERKAPMSNIVQGKRYAIYGAGNMAVELINKIRRNGAEAVMLIDTDRKKWGTVVKGLTVEGPSVLKEKNDLFDYIMIGSIWYYKEIKEALKSFGFGEHQLVTF